MPLPTRPANHHPTDHCLLYGSPHHHTTQFRTFTKPTSCAHALYHESEVGAPKHWSDLPPMGTAMHMIHAPMRNTTRPSPTHHTGLPPPATSPPPDHHHANALPTTQMITKPTSCAHHLPTTSQKRVPQSVGQAFSQRARQCTRLTKRTGLPRPRLPPLV